MIVIVKLDKEEYKIPLKYTLCIQIHTKTSSKISTNSSLSHEMPSYLILCTLSTIYDNHLLPIPLTTSNKPPVLLTV